MPYIGNDIQYGELNSQTFTGDGSTTAFTLTYTVSNVNSLLVTVADVIQEPTTAYTVSGTTLTFTSAPANSDTIHVRYLGRTLDVGTTAIVQDSDQDTKIQVEESADEDTIRFDTGGTERVTINSTSLTSTTPLYIPDGSASAPSVTNTGDTNTGIFFPTADTVGVAVGGTEVWRFGSNPTTAKNLIINGAMTVAQRGTSFVNPGDTTYTLDRWTLRDVGSPTSAFTITQDTEVPSTAGFASSMKVDCTTSQASVGADDLVVLQNRIEAQNLQHLQYGKATAKTVTLSLWMRSPKSGTHVLGLYGEDLSVTYLREVTIASADTWELISTTFPGYVTTAINNDTGAGLELRIPLLVGTNYHQAADSWAGGSGVYSTANQQNLFDNTANNFYITGVSLEVGSVATDFEHEPYSVTLEKCQRYYWRIQEFSTNAVPIGAGEMDSTTQAKIHIDYPVAMRSSTPTLQVSNVADFKIQSNAVVANSTNVTSDYSANPYKHQIAVTLSGGTAGQGVTMRTDGSSNGYIGFDAEL